MDLTSHVYPKAMTCVYRLYDCLDRLLYVGVAYDFDTRFKTHEKRKKWWPDVARRDVIWFDNRLDAFYEESRAIASESPLHNNRPGIHPIALAIIYNPASRWATNYANVPMGELIISSYDKERVIREVAYNKARAVVAVEGEQLGVMVDLDWYRRARAAMGMPPVERAAMAVIETDELVG